jgi:hypothetical protein
LITNSRVFDSRSEEVEKIILVNTVETPSQPSSSEIAESLSGGNLCSELSKTNEYGKVVKIAITDELQVLFCQVVLAKDKTTAITTNYLESTTKALECLLADAYTSVRGSLQVWYKRLSFSPNSAPATTLDLWGQACFVHPKEPTTIFDVRASRLPLGEACPHKSWSGVAPGCKLSFIA